MPRRLRNGWAQLHIQMRDKEILSSEFCLDRFREKKNPTATYFFFTREQLKKVACYDLWSSLIYRLEKFSGVYMKEVNDASLYRLGSQAGRQNALRMKSQNIIMWVERLYLRNKHIFLQRNFPDFWGKFGIFPVSLTPLPLVWRGHRCVPFLYQ